MAMGSGEKEVTTQRYSAILADPPWAYRNFGGSTSGCRVRIHGNPLGHYSTMSDEDIAAIPVSSWAPESAVLFLWATWPRLEAAFRVMPAWGFPEYVTAIPWVKTIPSSRTIYRGVGVWTMGASEVLLIARRGNIAIQHEKTGKQIGLLLSDPPVFYAPRSEHSRKPTEIHEWIERIMPDGPYLELFARRPRAGWVTWGNELGFHLSAAGVAPCELPDTPMPLFESKPAATGREHG